MNLLQAAACVLLITLLSIPFTVGFLTILTRLVSSSL